MSSNFMTRSILRRWEMLTLSFLLSLGSFTSFYSVWHFTMGVQICCYETRKTAWLHYTSFCEMSDIIYFPQSFKKRLISWKIWDWTAWTRWRLSWLWKMSLVSMGFSCISYTWYDDSSFLLCYFSLPSLYVVFNLFCPPNIKGLVSSRKICG